MREIAATSTKPRAIAWLAAMPTAQWRTSFAYDRSSTAGSKRAWPEKLMNIPSTLPQPDPRLNVPFAPAGSSTPRPFSPIANGGEFWVARSSPIASMTGRAMTAGNAARLHTTNLIHFSNGQVSLQARARQPMRAKERMDCFVGDAPRNDADAIRSPRGFYALSTNGSWTSRLSSHQTLLVCRKLWIASAPFSRPIPLFLNPPNGELNAIAR